MATLTLPGGTVPPPQSRETDDLLAADARVPGLLRRYRPPDDESGAGVLTLCRSGAAARYQLDAAEQSVAEWFDTPILLLSTLSFNQPRLPPAKGVAMKVTDPGPEVLPAVTQGDLAALDGIESLLRVTVFRPRE